MTQALVKDPIYFQAIDRLRQLLTRGEFAPGDRFLTERQIAERFAISRATANKALASLVAEGALEFRKGVGTFVRDKALAAPLDYDLRALVSFTEKALAAGKAPTTRVLALEAIAAQGDGFAPGEPLWRLERLRLADGLPVIDERRLLVRRLCPALTPERAAGSLYAYLADVLRLPVAGADETIAAHAATADEARRLGIPEGAACLCVTAVATLTDGTPLWQERTLYRGDAYVFHNRLGPITRAAIGAFTQP